MINWHHIIKNKNIEGIENFAYFCLLFAELHATLQPRTQNLSSQGIVPVVEGLN